MAFTFAYSLGSTNSSPEEIDFDLTASGTYTPALGDAVVFDSNGKIVSKHVTGDTSTVKVGISTGANFLGLATSGTYAATTASIYNPSLIGKVYVDPAAVYRIPWTSSATSAVVGTAYGITTVSGDQQLDVSKTGSVVKFMLVDKDTSAYPGAANGYAYVTIQSTNRIYG